MEGGCESDLRKALEWELSLEGRDLRSHAWYHGTIPRTRAEEILSQDAEFLVRDCISRPGDYVLTCKWKDSPLHFVINKVVFQPYTVYERIQYQFEDDCFDTVPDLVTYYVGNRRPISAASGAVIYRPVNRTMPLSYYATRYGLECQMHYAALALEKVEKEGEEGRRMSQPDEEPHPNGNSTMPRSASHDYPRKSLPNFSTLQHAKKEMTSTHALLDKKLRSSQESAPENTKEESKEETPPPPKPSRVPSKNYGTTTTGSRNTSGNVTPSPHLYSELNFPNGEQPTTPTPSWTGPQSPRDITVLPSIDPPSSFDPTSFATALLPGDNKPLDPTALAKVRCMVLEGGARVIAAHLTKADLEVMRLMPQDEDLGLGVLTGFEMLVLPQGKQLRMDLLERTACLKYFVAVTVLTCGDQEVRAQVVNKWIQIAIETKTALGNLYGYTGIMQGLELTQITRLKSTWLKLRQTYTDTAFAYETKLRPTLKHMQECSNPQAPNTCIPYLLSLLHILQKHQEVVLKNELQVEVEVKEEVQTLASAHKEKGRVVSLGLPWEQTASDYGLQLLLTHLEGGRNLTQQWPAYRRNSEIVLGGLKCDDVLLDACRTQFHMRFLWGSKGCLVDTQERYGKFEQVLDVMSGRCEPLEA